MNNAQIAYLGNHAVNKHSHVHWNFSDKKGLQVEQ